MTKELPTLLLNIHREQAKEVMHKADRMAAREEFIKILLAFTQDCGYPEFSNIHKRLFS